MQVQGNDFFFENFDQLKERDLGEKKRLGETMERLKKPMSMRGELSQEIVCAYRPAGLIPSQLNSKI
jgi:hypothetical protein